MSIIRVLKRHLQNNIENYCSHFGLTLNKTEYGYPRSCAISEILAQSLSKLLQSFFLFITVTFKYLISEV